MSRCPQMTILIIFFAEPTLCWQWWYWSMWYQCNHECRQHYRSVKINNKDISYPIMKGLYIKCCIQARPGCAAPPPPPLISRTTQSCPAPTSSPGTPSPAMWVAFVIIQHYKMCCFDIKPSPSFETAAQTCQCVFKSVIKLVLCQ